MREQENKVFIRDYFDAFAGKPKPPEVLRKYIAESDLELLNHIVAFERSFPKYDLDEQDMIAEGNKVAVRFVIRGTGSEYPFFGAEVKDKKVSVQCFIIYQIEDKKIVDHWFLSDNLGMMQQLGAIPLDEKQDTSLTHMNVVISNKESI